MITKEDLKRFLDWPFVPENRILSIYLEIEPSWEETLRRRFEAGYKGWMQSLELETAPAEARALRKNIARADKFISGYKPSGRGLVLFVDAARDFFWTRELKFSVKSQAYWTERPYILPLLEAFDEYERYGVILADKTKARVFTYCLGEIEEEKTALAWNDVQHIRTSGKDNLRSAFKLQRTAEMHAQWHFSHVVEVIQDLALRHPFDRLILSGPKPAIDELYDCLPFQFQGKVCGRLSLPVETEMKALASALKQLQERIERQEETKLVDEFLKMSPQDTRRVLGLDAVLTHLDKNNVHKLIFSENFKPQGCRCSGCGYLFSAKRLMCGRCGALIHTVPYFLDEIARAVVQKGGTIEEVREAAAKEMEKRGGIGALLKIKERNGR